MRVVVATVALVVIGVLSVSLFSKLRSRGDFRDFVGGLGALRVVPGRWAPPLAALAVVAEAAVLGALVWPGGLVAGLAGATLLFGGFTAALSVAVGRRATTGCHCFGVSSTPVARRHVARSGVLAAASLVALGGAVTTSTERVTGLPAAQLIVAFAAAGFLVASLVWLDELLWLFRRPASPS
ncbi:MauE/DoxX family redox-associated membrane protein [Cryptosporangium arvum]|uniref:Hydrogenase maturation factor n=1 Tax=Cryptosporangium arvum DSM 44712 TaxID=927661 RepID=A0A010YQS2_9ACTN|nr:MauE/DoxX family redox-associated membrane protein [Cryptosporangium arvum]EXG82555.1 hydrogenase maturation factor [Cryptosporangium arvum DSM 44712]